MIRSAIYFRVDVGPEAQQIACPVRALARRMSELDGHEWHIIHIDQALFHGRYEPISAVALASENRGKQLDQRHPVDWRALVEPSAVAGDPHLKMANLLLLTDLGFARHRVCYTL